MEDDITGFHRCLDAVARERRFLAQLEGPPLKKTRAFVLDAMEKGHIRLVALDGSSVVGWCDITPHHYEGLDHVGELGMGVLKGYRGQGIGLALLQQSVEFARENGLEKVELEVFASNYPAIRLYEKEGFEIEGRKRQARKLDGKYDDIIVMGLMIG
jgi:ribosomal protein S18 acetylase RimI-like enzyme